MGSLVSRESGEYGDMAMLRKLRSGTEREGNGDVWFLQSQWSV